MKRYRLFQRRRAPSPPSRGQTRAKYIRYGTEHGCLYVSPSIPKVEHPLVLAAFEVHVRSGYGNRTPRGAGVSEVTGSLGIILISTYPSESISFAFYDWET